MEAVESSSCDHPMKLKLKDFYKAQRDAESAGLHDEYRGEKGYSKLKALFNSYFAIERNEFTAKQGEKGALKSLGFRSP